MLNNTGTRIFEIPIYGISEARFNKKWSKKADDFINTSYTLIGCQNIESEKKRLRGIFKQYEERPYRYNQIVGCLVVSIDRSDINLSLYLSDVQYRYDAKRTERLIKKRMRSGDHSYIGNLKSNSELAMEIKKYVNFEVENLKRYHKNYFLDTTAFDAIINHIDLLSIINKEDNPNE